MTGADVQALLSGTHGNRWILDSDASTVRIAHKTLWGMLNVKGVFTNVQGEGKIGQAGDVSGNLRVTAASLDTRNAKRDEHLRSADFFDVVTYPDIVVTVSSVRVRRFGELVLSADLEVRSIHAPLDLVARIAEQTTERIVVTTDTVIDRNQFGMSWNKAGMMTGLTTVSVTAVFDRAS
jgi:polyisoprenoid-binding protein YceI